MLNKEACEKALENLRILERKDNFKKWGGQVAPQISCDIFEQLISEHFDPQPYKFEELKKGMWVWDNRYKEVGLITLVCRYPHIRYCDGSISDSKFEEGCFFPVTKALEYQK